VPSEALIQDPMAVLAVLLGFLALLFAVERHPRYCKLFKFIPLLIFAYFIPTALTNSGIIPIASPIVASAFHPALAPVGVLLAVGGYVLGTYAGLLCAALLELVHKLIS
jgi:uncharacterized membrane protein